jgi:exosortase D (VPLPA-CTERM-specific)
MKIRDKLGSIPVILGACLAITLLWAYWPVFNYLCKKLLADDDYSFGILLPLVSGYIVYLKWAQLRQIPKQPAFMGLAVLALGLAIFILGEASTDLYTPSASFIVVLVGVLLLIGGGKLVRLLWFPLFLLFLMIPLPSFLVRQITLPLQLISSQLATKFLQMAGVVAVRQGNVIDLGVRQLQIVAACSGLRYILALLALGVIFCYFYQRRFWKVALLLLSLIPAAIIANAMRVAGMGVLPILQEGFWHAFSGWLIFVFCFCFLAMLNWIISFRQPGINGNAMNETPVGVTSDASPKLPSSALLIVAIIMIAISGYFAHIVGNISPVPLLRSFNNFPLELGPWQGKRSFIDPTMFEATRANAYLNADFQNSSKDSISLWIAYYENQKGGGSVHSPFTCLTGGGWRVVESGIAEVAPGRQVKAMLMDREGEKYLVYYWYLQRGRWLANEYINKFYLSYDGLLRRRADGALIRLITPVSPDTLATRERLSSFARLLIPVLPQFIQQEFIYSNDLSGK